MVDFRSMLSHGADIATAIWRHPANRERRLVAIVNFLGWQVSKRLLRQPRIMEFHGKKLKCYPDSTSTTAALYFNGLSDYWEMKFLLAYLRTGDNFLDVGANTGVYSMLAASRIGGDGSIDAFEPMEGMARRIEEQAELNCLENIRVHRLAVGDQNCNVSFGFSTSDAMMHVKRDKEAVTNGIQVQSIRLDDFRPDMEYAMGKMDIEGAEPLALAGSARRLHQSNPPVWLLELAGYSTYYGMTSAGVIGLLDDAGYDCAIFDPESGQLVFTDQPWKLAVQNVLAISRGRRSFVEGRIAGAGRA